MEWASSLGIVTIKCCQALMTLSWGEMEGVPPMLKDFARNLGRESEWKWHGLVCYYTTVCAAGLERGERLLPWRAQVNCRLPQQHLERKDSLLESQACQGFPELVTLGRQDSCCCCFFCSLPRTGRTGQFTHPSPAVILCGNFLSQNSSHWPLGYILHLPHPYLHWGAVAVTSCNSHHCQNFKLK